MKKLELEMLPKFPLILKELDKEIEQHISDTDFSGKLKYVNLDPEEASELSQGLSEICKDYTQEEIYKMLLNRHQVSLYGVFLTTRG